MNLFTEEDCREHVKGWIAPLCREIERQTEKPIRTVSPETEFEGKKDSPVYMADMEGCVVYLTSRAVGFNQYIPVLVVSEKKRRRQRHGVGHSRDYHPAKGSEYPNFDRAVANIVMRNREILLVATITGQKAQKLKVPAGVLLAPREDGNYSLHVGTLVVSPAQASRLAHIFSARA